MNTATILGLGIRGLPRITPAPPAAALALLIMLHGALWAVFSAASTTTDGIVFSGTLHDPNGAPIEDARVELTELGVHVVSGLDGGFAFAPVPPGTYTLVVQRLGFAPVVQSIVLDRSRTIEMTLTETPFLLAPVTVTATRVPARPVDTPLPTAELRPDRLQRSQGISLAQAVAELPGVRSLSTGEQIGKPVIRGLSGARVLTLDNGSRLEDYSWSDEDGPSVDLRLAERVEVIRGPASVLYGSDALGGVVNVIPAPLPDARGGAPFTRAGFLVYGASNNAEFGTGLRVDGGRGRVGWRLFGIGRHGGDIHTPDGEIPNTGYGAVNGEGAVGVRGDRADATLRFSHYGGEFKLLEAGGPPPTETGGEEGGPERRLGDDRVQLSGNLLRGAWRFEGKAQWQRHSLIELSDEFGATTMLNAAPAAATETTAFDLLLNTETVDLLAHHNGGTRWRGTLGVSGGLQKNDTRGPEQLVPEAKVSSGAAFAFEQVAVGRWTILAGVRGDARHLRTDGNPDLGVPAQTRDYRAFSADGGAVFRVVDGLSLAANAGRAWRAPTYFDLFADGPQIGEQRWILGDPGLSTETSLNLDGGVRWERGPVRAEASFYRNRIDDYIYSEARGDTLGGFPVFESRQADAALTGGEVGAEVQALPALLLRARGEFVRGTNDETGDPLPLIPPRRAVLGAEVTATSIGWARRARLGADLDLVDRQDRPGPYEEPEPGYVLVNLTAGIERTMRGRAFRADLRVSNLLDRKYRDFLSRYKAFAPEPGRNISLQLSLGL